MKKVLKFDLKYKQKIESGEYKVITPLKQRVEIVYWNFNDSFNEKKTHPLVAIVHCDNWDEIRLYKNDGTADTMDYSKTPLLIETNEESELSDEEELLTEMAARLEGCNWFEKDEIIKDYAKNLIMKKDYE